MALETLEFEAPIAAVLKELDDLKRRTRTPDRQRDIDALEQRLVTVRREVYAKLTPWQHVLVARHPSRPHTVDFVDKLFTEFTEIHGDRRFADDPAIVTGFAQLDGEPVLVVGHQKGRGTREKIRRNFGYARPEGYRKALRAMRLAEKFGRPIMIFVDTPAAYPGVESEERGVAEAIAFNLREMAMLEVPIVVVVSGEGGSGGALGIAIGDRVLMLEYAVYSVIPPEGCAAILWRDAERKIEAAEALRIRAQDLLAMQVVDEVVPEPAGGAHTDPDEAARLLATPLKHALRDISGLTPEERLTQRYEKFRQMGSIGLTESDAPSLTQDAPPSTTGGEDTPNDAAQNPVSDEEG